MYRSYDLPMNPSIQQIPAFILRRPKFLRPSRRALKKRALRMKVGRLEGRGNERMEMPAPQIFKRSKSKYKE